MRGREVWAFSGHVPTGEALDWLMQHILNNSDFRDVGAGRLAWSSNPSDVLQATAARGLKDTALDSVEPFPTIEVVADPEGNVHDMVALAAKEGAHEREAIFVVSGLVSVDFLETDYQDAQSVEIGSGQGLAFVVADTSNIRIQAENGFSHTLYVAATA